MKYLKTFESYNDDFTSEIVPDNLGCGSEVFATTTTLAPSLAHFNAIAQPIPRLAPVITTVLFSKWGTIYSFITPCTKNITTECLNIPKGFLQY